MVAALASDELPDEHDITSQFLTSAMQLYCKLLCCMGAATVRKAAVSKAYIEVIAWATSIVVPKLAAAGDGEGAKEGEDDASTKRKRKTRAKAAEAASQMTASSVIQLLLSAITEILKYGLSTDEFVQKGLAFAEALVASECSTNFACGIGAFLSEVNATCSGHAMENPLDASIQALWRHWLFSVGQKDDAGLLFSIRPAVQSLFKQWQRRDMLAWSTSELAMLAVDHNECPATLRFFFGLVSPSETMMQHFYQVYRQRLPRLLPQVQF